MAINTDGKKGVTHKEGLAHLRSFPLVKSYDPGYYYSLLMEEEDGTFTIVNRTGMPCWGALREYETGTRPHDDWPEDLRSSKHIFPRTGKPVAVAACFARGQGLSSYNPTVEQWNTFIEFIFHPELSPWRKACKDVELIKNEDGAYWGCVFKDTNIDPNIMVGLLRTNVLSSTKALNFSKMMSSNPNADPRLVYLASSQMDEYNMAGRIVPERWWNGEPLDISSGGTFYERESYNRPDISYLFGGKNNEGVVISKGWGKLPTLDDLSSIFADQLALATVES